MAESDRLLSFKRLNRTQTSDAIKKAVKFEQKDTYDVLIKYRRDRFGED